jgi:Undecaprenyl-phosphate glucose phosphotransferase
MDILLSGQAGAVALLETSIELRPIGASPVENFSAGNVGLAFIGCTDLQRRQAKSRDDADTLAREAWAMDRALRLFLLLIDRDEPDEVLSEYCRCLEDLLQNQSVDLFLRRSLYVDALPAFVQVKRVTEIIDSYRRASSIFETLLRDQIAIARVRIALDAIPLEIFGSETVREQFVNEASELGVFFDLVQLLKGDKDLASYFLEAPSRFRHIDNPKEIFECWKGHLAPKGVTTSTRTREEVTTETSGASEQSARSAFENFGRKRLPSHRSVSISSVSFDVVIILLSGIAFGILYNFEALGSSDEIFLYFGVTTVVTFLFVSVAKVIGLYDLSSLSVTSQIAKAVIAWVGVFLFLAGLAFSLKVANEFSRTEIFGFAALGLSLLIVQRALYYALFGRSMSFTGRRAILITDSARASPSTLAHSLLKYGFLLGHHLLLPANDDPKQLVTFSAKVVEYARGSNIEEILVGVDAARWGALKTLLLELRALPLPISLIPIGTASEFLNHPTHRIGDSLFIGLHRGPLSPFERSVKRTVDLAGALTGLLLLMPLLIMTAVLIKLDSRGPILFSQSRSGFNGRQFRILKFRTMSALEDSSQVQKGAKSDSRVTRVGRWLRRTNIDELPQLLNVLNGTMSLVGPRPHAIAHHNEYDRLIDSYSFRHHVKPGLTGWAQVNGFRGETSTIDRMQQRVEADLYYIDNWSLRLDFMIIVRTALETIWSRDPNPTRTRESNEQTIPLEPQADLQRKAGTSPYQRRPNKG